MKARKRYMALAIVTCMLTAYGAGSVSAKQGVPQLEVAKAELVATKAEAPEVINGVNTTGFPIVNEPITLSIFGSRDQNQAEWKDMLFFQEYQKMTGITLDFQEVPAQGFDEKKNLLFASNSLPDILFRSYLVDEQISSYGIASKQLMDLTPYMETFAPNINAIMKDNEVVRTSQTASDGKIYVLPMLDFSDTGMMGFKQWINQEWLKTLELEIPTTIEEMKDVLYAFRDKDPNGNGIDDEVPLGIREISSIYVLGGSFGLDHQFNDTLNIEDGQVKYWLADDKFKEYLMYLNELYTEKLLWQDYYKTDSRPTWRSNLANALFGTFYMPYSDVFINVEDQFIGYEPLTGPYGDQLWVDVNAGVNTKGAFAVSSTCKYPEAAIRWVDFFYSDEGSVFYRYGVEGETFTYDETGIPRINDSILNDSEGFMTALGKVNLVPGGGGAHLITNETDGIVASDLTKQVASILVPFLPETVYPRPSLDELTQERVNMIRQDLDKYRDESVTKFIIGEWDFSQWDTFCNTLGKIGLGEMEQIYQEAYDSLY